MAIYSPDPKFTASDKRLLSLLAKFLLERIEGQVPNSNLPVGEVVLTNKQAGELLTALRDLLNSKEFIESCYFVESLTDPKIWDGENLKEVYLSRRKRLGRSHALASQQWAEFQVRFGIASISRLLRPVYQMEYGYFEKMELKLLRAADLHPQVIDLVMDLVSDQSRNIENFRNGTNSLKKGSIQKLVADPIDRWRIAPDLRKDRKITINQIASMITVISNLSVIFTTRDWSVAGAISAIAGATANSLPDSN